MSVLSFFRVLFLFLAIIAASFLFPVLVAIFCGEAEIALSFAAPAAGVFAPAAIFHFAGRKEKIALSAKPSFLLAASAWIGACVLGAAPLYLSGAFPSFILAFFESASGFTTTGVTCCPDVEALPVAVNFWRCQMQWLGGMGILGLTAALFQIPGTGAFQLMKLEETGTERPKLKPKAGETAKRLWAIYACMTALQAALLLACGMPFLDALMHSFSTIATGGFSPKNEGIAWYGSSAAEWICIAFMLLSSINYGLHYRAIKGSFKDIAANSELKVFLPLCALSSAALAASLCALGLAPAEGIRRGAFQAVSIVSTTGFSSGFSQGLPPVAQGVIVLLMLTGACSGSTSGGVKVIRWVVMGKTLAREVKRMLHPSGVYSVRVNGRPMAEEAVASASAFIFLYFVLIALTALVCAACGLDLAASCTAALAIVGNIGSGIGDAGQPCDFALFPAAAKAWLSFAMLAGRLELYSILVFFFPSFWKK